MREGDTETGEEAPSSDRQTDKQIGKHTDTQRERRDRGRDGERERCKLSA